MSAMNKDDSVIEVRCPSCHERVRVAREKAEREFKALCPKGHEISLLKAL